MKKKLHNIINSDLFIAFIIIVSTLIISTWVFDSRNFFTFDDWNNLVQLSSKKITDFLQILPNSTYCSRPIGQLIVKILLMCFGLSYIWHAIFMIVLHIINALLVYYIFRKLINNKSISMMISLIFSMYPVSNLPSYWEAAMFDLFGTTLVLLSFLAFFKIKDGYTKEKKKSYYFYCFCMIFLYYLSLRTKEMFICFPVFLLFYLFFEYLKKIRKNHKKFLWKELFKKSIPVLSMIIIMFSYYIYTKIANGNYTDNPSSAYYYSFSVMGIIKNYFNYLFIYFNPQSLVCGDVLSLVPMRRLYKLFILIVSCGILFYSVYKSVKNDYSFLLAILAYSLFIAPVLPMNNLHAVWYLYFPAIPLAFICSNIIFSILKIFVFKNKLLYISYIFCFLTLLYINNNSNTKLFHQYWIDTAASHLVTYDYFKDLSEQYSADNIMVFNLPDGYTAFYYEDGGIINVAYEDNDLNVLLSKEDDYSCEDDTIFIDFNNYDFDLVHEGGSCDVSEH